MTGPVRRTQSGRIDRRRKIAMQKKDPRKQRAALVVIAASLLIVVGIIAAALITKFVVPSKHLIVSVDGIEYDRGDMIRELRIKQQSASMVGRTFRISEEIFKTFNEMVENQVIQLNAPTLGMYVTEKEIDEEIGSLLGPTGDNAPEDERQQIQREFRERYKEFLNLLLITESDHREFVRTYLIRAKVRQFVGDSVPSVSKQAHIYRMAVMPDDEVEIMKLKYEESVAKGGKNPQNLRDAFKLVAREFGRDDPEILRRGGDLGWAPEGIHSEYDATIFDLEVGDLSEPLPRFDDPNTVYFFMVSELEEARSIDPENKEKLKSNALQDWVNERKKNHEVFADLNSEIHDWIIKELKTTSRVTPTPQTSPFGF